jgi:hypothetical protein
MVELGLLGPFYFIGGDLLITITMTLVLGLQHHSTATELIQLLDQFRRILVAKNKVKYFKYGECIATQCAL